MTKNRRDFIRFLALLAAGTAALPEQIDAFERYYNKNTPEGEDLIAIDEISVSGMATHSMRVKFALYCRGEKLVNFGINAFGGVYRWVALPDRKLTGPIKDFTWRFQFLDAGPEHDLDHWTNTFLESNIHYIDETGISRLKELRLAKGTIG